MTLTSEMAASLSKHLRLNLRGGGEQRLLHSRASTSHAPSPPPPPPPPPSATAPPLPGAGKEASAWSKLFLFAPGAITFGLGTWQLFRRQEKIEMLDYRTRRLEMEPVAWNEAASSAALRDPDALEFRKIVCEGDFDEEKSVFVGPRSRIISGVTENGYYVITPLIPRSTEPGRHKIHASYLLQIEKPREPPVRVIGVIRGSEKPSIFVPANEPSSGQWFYVDVPMIAHGCGLPQNTLYIEDINEDVSPTNPYPVPKDVNTLIRHSVMPEDHLKYTFTWYTLAAAVTYMASKRIKAKKVRYQATAPFVSGNKSNIAFVLICGTLTTGFPQWSSDDTAILLA
ncbi:Surfeit locus protein 1 [Dichanthelium oligosanthes]|uniref:SURF1-like protein n=1 Tax=Dichanthelium oligosanthes TaxID=888268 RepID=A0A1E5VMQ8_9POAL|nr:Surfeit locus protein 1 [Dichanthelium oligosanthes]